MAYAGNSKNKEADKKPGATSRYFQNKKGKLLRNLRKIIGTIFACFLIYLLLSGTINQVKTGQNLLNYSLDIGKKIAYMLNKIHEGDGPLKITEDGVYFNDANPPSEGALGDLPTIDIGE